MDYRLTKYKREAAIFKVLAHPSRLLVVDELAKGERCVCELTAMVGSEMPTVSRHLSIWKNAGIVSDDMRGAQVYYRLEMPCVMNIFKCVSAVRQQNARAEAFVAG